MRVRIAAWQAAYRGLMPDGYLDAMGEGRERAAERLRERLSDPAGSLMLVVEDDDRRVVGMSVYGPARDDGEPRSCGQLHAINLEPRMWGTGLGQALLAEAQLRLAADGYWEAYLWVVDGNARARRFYERSGWRCDGGTKLDDDFGTGVTEVRYRRELPVSAE